MQTKFKDIAQYYLGTGLEVQTGSNSANNIKKSIITGLTQSNKVGYISVKNHNNTHIGFIDDCKPLLRSLDNLTKPITVKGYNDGKEFVPLDEIQQYDINAENILLQQFWIVNRLLQWHFNIFNLPETEYIKID